MIRRFAAMFQRGSYARDTATNTLGLLVAALVPIAIIPVLARLYDPSDFGLFGVFTASVGLGAIAATGRYEAAIALPEDKRGAAETAAVAVLFVLGVCVLLLGALLSGIALQFAPVADNAGLALLAIITVLVTATGQVFLNAAIREQMFRASATARIVGASASAVTSIGLGLVGAGIWGLALGLLVSYVCILAVLVRAILTVYAEAVADMTWRGVRYHAHRFRNFPLYSLPSDFANTFASNLPLIWFFSAFGSVSAGYLAMFQRIWAGTSILVQGLGETFRHRAATEFRQTGTFRDVFRVTLWPLAAIALLLLVGMLLLGPTVFAMVLGEQWRESGVYGQFLAILVCAQFIASPLSWSFYIVERLRLLMLWQWALLAASAATLWIGTTLFDERITLALMAGVGAVMYLIYLGMSYAMSGVQRKPAP